MGPLWDPFGSVVGSGWVIFGFTLGSHCDPHWVCVGFELGPLWGCFGTTLGLPLMSGFPLGRLWVCGWVPFGLMLGSLWVLFGSVLGLPWVPFRFALSPLWVHFGSPLGPHWVPFGFTLGSHCNPPWVHSRSPLGPFWVPFASPSCPRCAHTALHPPVAHLPSFPRRMRSARSSSSCRGAGCGGVAVDLSLTGLPVPVLRRPSSASPAKHVVRSLSVVADGKPKRNALVGAAGGALGAPVPSCLGSEGLGGGPGGLRVPPCSF